MNAARVAVTRAISSALRGDERSRKIGREHALIGLAWCCPGDADMLAYSLGFADGQSERACCCGDRAQAERAQ